MRRTWIMLAAMPFLLGAVYEWGGPAARGVRALRARRYEEALGALREGHADLPRSAALRYDQGLALEAMGRTAESQAAYKAAMAQRGDRARAAAAFNLGTRAMREQQFGDAVHWYRESLKVRPSDAATKRALEEAIRRARELPPKSPPRARGGERPPPGGEGQTGPPPDAGGGGGTPPPPRGPHGGSGEFSREQAEHWLDALEAERRAGQREDRGGASGSAGGRDW